MKYLIGKSLHANYIQYFKHIRYSPPNTIINTKNLSSLKPKPYIFSISKLCNNYTLSKYNSILPSIHPSQYYKDCV